MLRAVYQRPRTQRSMPTPRRGNILVEPFASPERRSPGQSRHLLARVARPDERSYNDFVIGNVNTDDFADLPGRPVLAKMSADIQAGVALCREQCAYFEVCGGGEPVNKIAENGTFASAATSYCRMTRMAVADLVMLRAACRLASDRSQPPDRRRAPAAAGRMAAGLRARPIAALHGAHCWRSTSFRPSTVFVELQLLRALTVVLSRAPAPPESPVQRWASGSAPASRSTPQPCGASLPLFLLVRLYRSRCCCKSGVDLAALAVNSRLTQRARRDVERELLRNLLHQDDAFYIRRSPSEIISRLGGDLHRVGGRRQIVTQAVATALTIVAIASRCWSRKAGSRPRSASRCRWSAC